MPLHILSQIKSCRGCCCTVEFAQTTQLRSLHCNAQRQQIVDAMFERSAHLHARKGVAMRRHIFLISMLLSGLSYGASKSGSVMNGAIVVQLCTSQILAYKRMLDERAKVRLAISSYLLAPAAQADHAQMLLASQICNSITILTRFYYRDQGPRYVLEQLLIQPKN